MSSPSAPQLARHFVGWDAPLLGSAVRWLSQGWAGDRPLDLSGVLVVVPTRQAGRRLRAALAAHAAQGGQAVFPPRIAQPESLVAPPESVGTLASPLATTLAWVDVLLAVDLAECRALFPVDPPRRNFAWAHDLAVAFSRLQATLAEAALTLEGVPARLAADFGERERWEQLGELGRRHAAALRERGLLEPQRARLAAARAPAELAGVQRVVVIGVADPLPLALEALAWHAARGPVELLIGAPASEAAAFDEWGRPRGSAWMRRDAPWQSFDAQVHPLPDAQAQAEWIAGLAARYPRADGSLGVGLADSTLAALTATALGRAGRAAFNPAGESHAAHGLHHFLRALAEFHAEPTFAHALALARRPEVLAWLHAELGAEFSAVAWLAQLDRLQQAHLPGTLAEARAQAKDNATRYALAQRGLALLSELRTELRQQDFAPGAAAVLTRVFAARQLDLDALEDRRFAAAAEAWSEVVRECAAAAEKFPAVQRDEWWALALRRFAELGREAEKPAGALELQGWLELPFEDAPHVVVAGANEGAMPEAVTGDVFLPESLRTLLGLKTNAERFARDSYLLHLLVASRRAGGRVDVLLGRTSEAGDPLRPSRLLLQCADAELPARVERLFHPTEAGAALPAWERAFPLRPRRAAVPEKLSATAFRSYLECPFRFYLRHVLGMEALDASKRELDAFDFGSLCHLPLEKLAQEPWRDCRDEALLAQMLVEEFDRVAAQRFGQALSVPLVAQLESARQRLRWAAKVQAAERTAGWVIHAIERDFTLEFGGLRLRGRIDRIDRHETTGAWRVIDYKTTDSAKLPAEAHLAAPWERTPAWARLRVDGREKQWTDLQLPLYLHALPQIVPEAQARAAAGYFLLPKAATATAVAMWDGYSLELHESALACAQAVAAAVKAGEFWPPNEELKPDADAFAALFHRGVAASVAWEAAP